MRRLDTHVRIRCPSQVFAECGSFSTFNINYSLIDCGGAFSKQLTSQQPAYTAAALKIAGGDERPADGESSTVNVVGYSVVMMSGSLLASSGGGTGVEMTSGGASGGSDLITSFRAYNSAIYGFDTDLRKATEGSWEPQDINKVRSSQVGSDYPRGIFYPFRSISPTEMPLTMWMTGTVRVFGYDSAENDVEEKASIWVNPAVNEPDLAVDTQVAVTYTGSEDYFDRFIVVVEGPSEPRYSSVPNGSPPVIPLQVKIEHHSGNAVKKKDLWITLPPDLHVPSGEKCFFLVGEHGETFRVKEKPNASWDAAGSLDLENYKNNLASEWAEMSVRATAYRESEGLITVHPSLPMN
jgi:hypothetical protein